MQTASIKTEFNLKINQKSQNYMQKVWILFVVTVNMIYSVRYKRETLLAKYAKPNQSTQYVRYNRVSL